MLSLGWVVAATDYVGLGTPGTEAYLVGQDEARDVVNSVRAARSISQAQAGDRWVVWGHSQGGHAAIWTGELAGSLAPELHLLGVAAAAPAAELPEIMQAQWNTPIGWVIGPAVATAWPLVDPSLPTSGIISQQGQDNTARLQAACITQAAIEAILRDKAGQQYFSVNPSTNVAWFNVAKDQSPSALPSSLPFMLAQGTADDVVLPGPNALLQNQWCAAGSTITALWMGGVNHMTAANTAGPAVVPWINDRFHGVPAGRTCLTPPPVPASVAVPTAS
jgi:pimeloyl-ACP methyl ester carboxylesterase